MRLLQAARLDFSPVEDSRGRLVSWISGSRCEGGSYVMAYRLAFVLPEAASVRIHVSADQRYRLFVDGDLEGEGPERGDLHSWYYQSYELALEAGAHCLVALVWTLESGVGIVPSAQMTLRHGFVLCAEERYAEMLSTGIAEWECKRLEGVRFVPSGLTGAGLYGGGVVEIDGRDYPWGVEQGRGEDWAPAVVTDIVRTRLSTREWGLIQGPLLTPGFLPPPYGERHRFRNVRHVAEWAPGERCLPVVSADALREDERAIREAFEGGTPVRIGPDRRLWILIDLQDYYCGYPEIETEGGAGSTLRVLWAEGLYESPDAAIGDVPPRKGNRDEIEGKYFFGRGDTFCIGERPRRSAFTSFWWSCGRYVALFVETASEALTLRSAGLRESRFPLEKKAEIHLSNEAFEQAQGIMWRSLQMCSHETYMDCPYYEQLNYTGDTRVQALTTYAMTGDDRLAKKCIELFSNSMLPNGLTQSRYPASDPQIIPQFSLYWVCMLYDYALWRGDAAFVKRFLPKIRCVLDTFLAHVAEDGLLRCPDGWDWVDWCAEWETQWGRTHPRGPEGASAVNHLQLVYTLGLATKLERWVGKGAFAEHYACERDNLWQSALETFWDEARGLFAATSAHNVFDEHTQCFAVLSGLLDREREASLRQSLVDGADLSRATYYFQFYLFSAYAALNLPSQIVRRLEGWRQMVDLGLKTTLESPDPSRSDCHAWSSHPLYHAIVSLCGIQPTGFGFEEVRIVPALDALASASVRVPHLAGFVSLRWNWQKDGIAIEVDLPRGLNGEIVIFGETRSLAGGFQRFFIERDPVPSFDLSKMASIVNRLVDREHSSEA